MLKIQTVCDLLNPLVSDTLQQKPLGWAGWKFENIFIEVLTNNQQQVYSIEVQTLDGNTIEHLECKLTVLEHFIRFRLPKMTAAQIVTSIV